ncbi:hypothetical protein AKJ51_01800 [candidate division MSBL1 archaeon SCGC-AAA382A20]|uniref:HTH-type transcriptional regulator SarZ n=1 Tax=candidate division MSBL1 archaeon SCGC-AAA382A20 TaxID=1698280 RepID=A0A133VLD9_9EURY|nr:hypothetical protein AKJ51_01800 [candidate division MSBL1 archaeon SCGC-AAA382A20]
MVGDNKKVIDLIIELKRKCQLKEEDIRKEIDVMESAYNTFLALEPGNELSSKEFAEKLDLSPSRGTRVIEKLVKDGSLERKRSEEDRRRVSVSLTEKGIEEKKKIESLKNECEERIISNFSENEIKKIRGILKDLVEVL